MFSNPRLSCAWFRAIIFTIACFAGLVILNGNPVRAEGGISLQITGDSEHGFAVVIAYKGHPLTATDFGEISARLQNGSREIDVPLQHWRASSWRGDGSHITLQGVSTLENLKTDLAIQIDYDVLSPHVVRKRIQLHQVDAHLLWYQVTNVLQPADSPAKFWSFDQPSCKGGPLHEYFPSVGFRTRNGVTVGLLTDTGYHNGWNRIIRRDNGEFIKPAPGEISDVNLNYVSGSDQRSKGEFFVSQTFGEIEALDAGPEKELPIRRHDDADLDIRATFRETNFSAQYFL